VQLPIAQSPNLALADFFRPLGYVAAQEDFRRPQGEAEFSVGRFLRLRVLTPLPPGLLLGDPIRDSWEARNKLAAILQTVSE
jgi:hypothetical protein